MNLPTFSDWRIAYIGQDERLHIVSLDGKTDLTGVMLPVYSLPNTGVFTAGTSPDGEYLAYGDAGGIKYLDVHSDKLSTVSTAYKHAQVGTPFAWSPDGRSVVIDGGSTGSAIVQLPSGAITQTPTNNLDATGNPLTAPARGWLDQTHLAVEDLAVEFPTPQNGRTPTPQTIACLARLDITSGQIQPIVTLRSPTMAGGQFNLTPDGTEAIFSNADSQDFPFTPNVQRVDLATGVATPLLHLESLLPALGGFTQLLWLPHTHMALAATGFPENGDLRYQIIDIDHDTAIPVTLSGYPVAWSPDGKTLILSNDKARLAKGEPASDMYGIGFDDVGEVNSGPYTLTAVTFDANWRVSQTVTLTTKAMQIPVLGFVRNP